MVGRVGDNASRLYELQIEISRQQQTTIRANEVAQQEASKIQEQQQLDQNSIQQQTATEQDWAQIEAEIKAQQTKFEFDPNQDYQLQVDKNGQLTENFDFVVSANLNRQLYNDVIDSVNELIKISFAEEQSKVNETANNNQQFDFSATWQQDAVNEAIQNNREYISGLETVEVNVRQQVQQHNPIRAPQPSQAAASPTAMRVDDPRLRYAHLMAPAAAATPRPRPVERPSAQNNGVANNLSVDLRLRMMMGNQQLAAAGAGAAAVRAPANTTSTAAPKPAPAEEAAANTAPKIPLQYAQKTAANFASFMTNAARFGNSMDINSLIQFIIREAYMEGLNDVVYIRDKVQYNLEAKKILRQSLNAARDELARVKAQAAKEVKKLIAESESEVSSTDAEKWLNEHANQAINYTAVKLDTSVDPPVMAKTMTTIDSTEKLEDEIKNMESDLASLGDDNQMANADLQNVMQKQEQYMSMVSNISKLLNDTALAVIRKIG